MRIVRRLIQRLVSEDDGIALILAILVMTIVTIMAVGAAGLITSTQNTSSNERQGAVAFTGGEAGLDLGANWVLSTYNGSAPPFPGPGFQHTESPIVDGKTSVSWTATYLGTSTVAGPWTITSVTHSPNGKAIRTLQETLSPATTPGGTTTSSIYDYGFVMGGTPSGGTPSHAICSQPTTTYMAGSATVVAPVWINGDVCVTGGADPSFGNPSPSSLISAYIGGSLFVSGVKYAIGDPAGVNNGKVASALIVGGCWADPHAGWTNLNGCDLNPNLNANSSPTAGSGVQALNYAPTLPSPTPGKPPFEKAQEAAAYANSATCATGSSPLADTDGLPNLTLGSLDFASTITTTPWDCVTPGGDELKFIPASGGTKAHLYIRGHFFIDGDVKFSSSSTVLYTGTGTLYVDGTVFFPKNGGSLCAGTTSALSTGSCDTSWDPNSSSNTNLLELVAINHSLIQAPPPRSTTSTGFSISSPQGDSMFQGIAFVNGGFNVGASGRMTGSVIADEASLQGSGSFTAITTPPPDAVGGSTPALTTTWSIEPHTWRECPSATGCQ